MAWEIACHHASSGAALGLPGADRCAGRGSMSKTRPGRVDASEAPLRRGGRALLNPEHITMANPFVHVELNTTDTAAAKAFYGKLFDWHLEDMPMPNGTYTMIKVGEGTGGGIVKHP